MTTNAPSPRMPPPPSPTRRGLLGGGAALGVGAASVVAPAGPAPAQAAAQPPPDPDAAMRRPVPPQRPASMGLADLGDVKLEYWDTGAPPARGDAPVIVLMHPGTGSNAIWGYQQPVLAEAGYRVIAYSRRGYLGSEDGPEAPSTGAGDLLKLLDRLGIDRFHAVGCAAGAIYAADFALSHPGRLRSLVLACTHLGVQDPDYVALNEGLRPKGFDAMPAEFREVGPSYRAANPQGTARWVELEHQAIPRKRVRQGYVNRITWAALRRMTVPTLLIGGDADLWAPPASVRLFAANIPNSRMVILTECGHSGYWEQPEAFNGAVLEFLAQHRG